MKDKIDLWIEAIQKILEGDSSPLSARFVSKHLGKIILVLFILYSHVQMRYTYEEVISEISIQRASLSSMLWATEGRTASATMSTSASTHGTR